MSDYSEYTAKNVSGLYEGFIRKETTNVEHRDGVYIVNFGSSLVGQGVVFPDNLGFKPEKGMKAIWDADDSMGSVGDLSFYDKDGNLLCALHRDKASLNQDWKKDWSERTLDEKIKLNLQRIDKAKQAEGELARLRNEMTLKRQLERIPTEERTSEYRSEFRNYAPAIRVLGNALLDTGQYSNADISELKILQKMISDPKKEQALRSVYGEEDGALLALTEIRKLQEKNILGKNLEIIDGEKFKESPLVTEGKGISDKPVDLRHTPTMQTCRSFSVISNPNSFTK